MEKILVVDNVTKEYPGRKAVTGISFSVLKGSIHGFLGPNGAGKSTTMRMIAGLLPPSEGTITLNGRTINSQDLSFKNEIGLLPENPPLYLDMSVKNYLKFVASLHNVPDIKEKVEHTIDRLSLKEVKNRLIGNLSKGYKQRVGLAQALIYDAPFLILDEPTNGLDPQTVVELRDFIKELSKEKTILFSSHILSEVEQLCDHITIIHEGIIRASGDINQIHKKFRQGLVLKVGIGSGQKFPDLKKFGKYEITSKHISGVEDQYHLTFEDEKDCRVELARYILNEGVDLYTLKTEPPELEDIFLHMTETKK